MLLLLTLHNWRPTITNKTEVSWLIGSRKSATRILRRVKIFNTSISLCFHKYIRWENPSDKLPKSIKKRIKGKKQLRHQKHTRTITGKFERNHGFNEVIQHVINLMLGDQLYTQYLGEASELGRQLKKTHKIVMFYKNMNKFVNGCLLMYHWVRMSTLASTKKNAETSYRVHYQD